MQKSGSGAEAARDAGQFGAGAIETRFDGTDRDPGGEGDIAVIHVFEVAEDHRLAQLRFQLSENRLHEISCLALCKGTLGIGGVVCDDELKPGVVVEGGQEAIVVRGAVVVDQKIASQTAEPGGKRGVSAAEGAEGAEHTQKDLLGKIFSGEGIACKAIAEAVNEPGIPANENFPCVVVSGEASRDKLIFAFFARRRISAKRYGKRGERELRSHGLLSSSKRQPAARRLLRNVKRTAFRFATVYNGSNAPRAVGR